MIPFSLVTALFFLWGVPNNLNDVLIRQFMKSFALSRFEAGLIQSAFYFGYFMLAIPAALLMRRFGYRAGILIGFALFSTGAFLFWPAATSFFMSLMFPTIFALGIKNLGPNTKLACSLLVMAIIGGAVLTPIMGIVAEASRSIPRAYLLPLLGYVFVAAYGFWGATLGRSPGEISSATI
jgi:fucose permease